MKTIKKRFDKLEMQEKKNKKIWTISLKMLKTSWLIFIHEWVAKIKNAKRNYKKIIWKLFKTGLTWIQIKIRRTLKLTVTFSILSVH